MSLESDWTWYSISKLYNHSIIEEGADDCNCKHDLKLTRLLTLIIILYIIFCNAFADKLVIYKKRITLLNEVAGEGLVHICTMTSYAFIIMRVGSFRFRISRKKKWTTTRIIARAHS